MKIYRTILNRKGAAAVEFALVLPIFALLMLGIIEFGWYFFVQHTIQFATREGTRLALVGGKVKDQTNNYLSREDSIIKTIKDNAAMAVNTDMLQISIFPVGSGYTDPDNWETALPNAGEGGDYMRVRVRYSFNFITPLISSFFPSGVNVIKAETLYRNELFPE